MPDDQKPNVPKRDVQTQSTYIGPAHTLVIHIAGISAEEAVRVVELMNPALRESIKTALGAKRMEVTDQLARDPTNRMN